jgi:hypothetical protein
MFLFPWNWLSENLHEIWSLFFTVYATDCKKVRIVEQFKIGLPFFSGKVQPIAQTRLYW